MGKKKKTLGSLEIALCCSPIIIEVIRIALDGEANGRNMGALAGVAVFGLSAMLGQRWAVRLAPAAFLAAMGDLLVFSVLTSAPIYYWAMMGVLVWAGGELAMAKDVRANLEARG